MYMYVYIVRPKWQSRTDTMNKSYFHNFDIRRTLVGNTIVDHSDEAGASRVGAAPTSSSFAT